MDYTVADEHKVSRLADPAALCSQKRRRLMSDSFSNTVVAVYCNMLTRVSTLQPAVLTLSVKHTDV